MRLCALASAMWNPARWYAPAITRTSKPIQLPEMSAASRVWFRSASFSLHPITNCHPKQREGIRVLHSIGVELPGRAVRGCGAGRRISENLQVDGQILLGILTDGFNQLLCF